MPGRTDAVYLQAEIDLHVSRTESVEDAFRGGLTTS
jgi:hypothetical protein